MSACLIISDLHLSADKDELNRAFVSFLKTLDEGAHLIIAGDFFDFFVGVNAGDPFMQMIRAALRDTAGRGVRVSFLCGNRDFLVSSADAAFFGMGLLPEFYPIEIGTSKALLIHGDELCLNDKSFQRFRALGHNPLARLIFMALPYSLRHRIGQRVRNQSSMNDPSRKDHPERFGLVADEAVRLLELYGCDTLIHGHFHVFGEHEDEFFAGSRRLALGAWGENYSFVRIEDGHAALVERPLSELL